MRSILVGAFVLSVFFIQQNVFGEERRTDELSLEEMASLYAYGAFLDQPNDLRETLQGLAGPDEVVFPGNTSNDPGDLFPSDPSDSFPSDPSSGAPSYFPPYYPGYSSRTMGSAYLVAMQTLYQTLMFYGVAHVVKREGNRIDFAIVHSKNGYFENLDRSQVAFALREFSRYLLALLCGKATPEKFYQMFMQVPAEEIGLRFKYDMAWALLGNPLPKNANEVLIMGERWKAIRQILSTTGTLNNSSEESKELRNWAAGITDVVNVLQRLNRIMCYVDIRPKPKQELKKRIVIKKLLRIERELNSQYDKYEEILKEMEAAAEGERQRSYRDSVQ